MKKFYTLLLTLLAGSIMTNAQYFVSTGGTKYVLMEHSMGNWAGFCPDAQQDIFQSVLPGTATAIHLEWHSGPGDSMMVAGDPYCTGTGYITGYPQGTVDRALIGGVVPVSRPWESHVAARAATSANFQVDMNSSFNPYTRVLTVTVTGKALASLTGTWNINAYVAEDSISSAGSGYVQTSLLNATTTACNGMACWWLGLGNPLSAANYYHRNVARKVLAMGGSIWGDGAFTNPTSGTTASRTYTYTVPATYNANRMKVIGLVQKYGASTSDRAVENAISSEVRLMPAASMTSTSDSFLVSTGATCSGADFFVSTNSYYAGLSVLSEFGDATTATHTILGGGSGGHATFSHAYATPGTYTVKHILLAGSAHIDSVSYSYNYRLCNTLAARFYYDGNSNCTYDGASPDVLLSTPVTTRIDSNGVPVDTIVSLGGLYYTAYGVSGDTYTMQVISYGATLVPSCPTTGAYSDTLSALSYATPLRDFGFNCSSSSTFDLSVNTSTRAFANRLRSQIVVQNLHCNPTTGTLKMNFSPKYVFGSATIAPSSSTATELTWNLSALSAITSPVNIIVLLNYNPSTGMVPTGDTVHTFFTLTPIAGDSDTTNNRCHELDTASGSFDPNYVEANPSDCVAPGVKELTYTIGFENMGSDTAYNIYVLDTLSDNLDVSTLAPIVSTHKMNIYKYTAGGRNIVKFDFPNIKLPDSSHHLYCQGMLKYKVKTKNLTVLGTQIPVRAGIYFDVNPVVMTNTASTSVCFPTGIPVSEIPEGPSVFPNPATDELTVSAPDGTFSSFTVFNTIGRAVTLPAKITNGRSTVDISALPAGLYYVSLKGNHGNEVLRFVKL